MATTPQPNLDYLDEAMKHLQRLKFQDLIQNHATISAMPASEPKNSQVQYTDKPQYTPIYGSDTPLVEPIDTAISHLQKAKVQRNTQNTINSPQDVINHPQQVSSNVSQLQRGAGEPPQIQYQASKVSIPQGDISADLPKPPQIAPTQEQVPQFKAPPAFQQANPYFNVEQMESLTPLRSNYHPSKWRQILGSVVGGAIGARDPQLGREEHKRIVDSPYNKQLDDFNQRLGVEKNIADLQMAANKAQEEGAYKQAETSKDTEEANLASKRAENVLTQAGREEIARIRKPDVTGPKPVVDQKRGIVVRPGANQGETTTEKYAEPIPVETPQQKASREASRQDRAFQLQKKLAQFKDKLYNKRLDKKEADRQYSSTAAKAAQTWALGELQMDPEFHGDIDPQSLAPITKNPDKLAKIQDKVHDLIKQHFGPKAVGEKFEFQDGKTPPKASSRYTSTWGTPSEDEPDPEDDPDNPDN